MILLFCFYLLCFCFFFWFRLFAVNKSVSNLFWQTRSFCRIFVMNFSSYLKFVAALVCILLAFVTFPTTVECAKKASAPSTPSATSSIHEPVIEEVTQKQLERILQDKDYVAVYWCKWSRFNSFFFN